MDLKQADWDDWAQPLDKTLIKRSMLSERKMTQIYTGKKSEAGSVQ